MDAGSSPKELQKNNDTKNINKWYDILTKFFGVDEDDLPNYSNAYTSYSSDAIKQLWTKLSAKLKGLMSDQGTFADLSKQLLYHTAGLSPSPFDSARDYRSMVGDDDDEETEASEPPQKKQKRDRDRSTHPADDSAKQLAQAEKTYFDHYQRIKHHIKFNNDDLRPGTTLLLGFEQSFKEWAVGQRISINNFKNL